MITGLVSLLKLKDMSIFNHLKHLNLGPDQETDLTRAEPFLTEQLANQVQDLPLEEGQVIIHINHHPCYSTCLSANACRIIVDSNIFLQPNNNLDRSLLVHAVNAKVSPASIPLTKQVTRFTLVFSGIPKSASSFDFIEPGPRGWQLLNIKRNRTDVYELRIHKSDITIIS